MISPRVFESNGITVKKTLQEPLQVVTLLPGTFHFGNISYLMTWLREAFKNYLADFFR